MAQQLAREPYCDRKHGHRIARPIVNLLEGQHEVILVNAQHMKAVPGRKTDIKDSEWLASLLRQGLLAASFIPPKPIRDVRDLVRYRKSLVNQRSQEINRIQKVLETANIKLACGALDAVGVSGRAMLHALIEGLTDAPALAELSRGTLRRKCPQLQEAVCQGKPRKATRTCEQLWWRLSG